MATVLNADLTDGLLVWEKSQFVVIALAIKIGMYAWETDGLLATNN